MGWGSGAAGGRRARARDVRRAVGPPDRRSAPSPAAGLRARRRQHTGTPVYGAPLAEALAAVQVTLSAEDLAAIARPVRNGAAAGERDAATQLAMLDRENAAPA